MSESTNILRFIKKTIKSVIKDIQSKGDLLIGGKTFIEIMYVSILS